MAISSDRTTSNQNISGHSHMNTPTYLQPFISLGVDLEMKGNHGVGDCPFCSKEGHFSVDVSTGLWRCFVCGSGSDRGGGNALTFIRLLHEHSMSATIPHKMPLDRSGPGGKPSPYPTNPNGTEAKLAAKNGGYGQITPRDLIKDRKLCSEDTLAKWGMCQSIISPHRWIIPGYSTTGRLDQLYTRTPLLEHGEWNLRLLPTPELWEPGKAHGLHLPASDFNPKRQNIYICEGPWDGMALWEILHTMMDDVNVIAVPGCNVWRREWTEMCRGKTITLLFDSDHPRQERDKTFRAGYDGMIRVAKQLVNVASEIKWVKWGSDGFDPEKPDGWDVRDEITTERYLVDRRDSIGRLFSKIEAFPVELLNGMVHVTSAGGQGEVESQSCNNWQECENAWKEALRWRKVMGDALAVLFSVCASTMQGGNQLFLQLVGNPGSGKSTMCDGLLVSRHCHRLDHLTGFFSGWKKPGEEDKDCSLLARINGKTLITSEADTLMSDPRFDQMMGQLRRIFDGRSSSSYKNTDQDRHYDGLRTPVIMAGTPKIMDCSERHQAHLGDRFTRFIIDDPDKNEEREILRAAMRSEMLAMLETSNGTSASLLDPKLRKAHALTGGYVNWLRANIDEQIQKIDISEEAENSCIDLAITSAYLRARPNEDRRKITHNDSRELPSRLTRQYGRMAKCLAVVLNKKEVDKDVIRIVRKVALDTAHGYSLNVVRWFTSINPKAPGKLYQETGIQTGVLCTWLGMSNDRGTNYLSFMRRTGILEMKQTLFSDETWFLTDMMYDLFSNVIGGSR